MSRAALEFARHPQMLAWIEQRLGLSFPAEREAELARHLASAAAETGVHLDAALAASPTSPATPSESLLLQALARRLTVGETYFFREPATLDVIERHILPELIRRRRARGHRRLRLWSAGCCTGEEPYTLAMLLERALPDIDDWDVRILATDLNRDFLQRAALGRYKGWSFRQIPPETKIRFFTETEPGVFAVHPRLRARVTYAPLNLAEDNYPSPAHDTGEMDLILCRNVLMYFSERQASAAMTRLRRSLADSGWLALSPTEHALRHARGFRSVSIDGAFLYQKTHDKAGRVPSPKVPVPTPLAAANANATPHAPSPRQSPALVARATPPPRHALPSPFPARAPTPDDPASRARAAADRGELPTALHSCEQALAADRMNPALHELRARILEELGRPREAAEELRRVLYLAPNSLHAHFALGNLASRQGASAEARRSFTRLLDLLRAFPAEAELPDMEGLTAGRLTEIVRTLAPEAS